MPVSIEDGTAIAAAPDDHLPSVGVARSAEGFLQVVRPAPDVLTAGGSGMRCTHKFGQFALVVEIGTLQVSLSS